MQNNVNSYHFETLGDLLILSEEEFQRFVPDLVRWHAKFRNAVIANGDDTQDFNKWGLRWHDDGMDYTIIEEYYEDLIERRSKKRGQG